MNYPSIKEYKEAILLAEDNFDQLKNLRPVLEDDGSPVMTSGNFAVVFKMKDEQTGKLHAVKCFLREQEGRAEAYRQIAEELEFVSSTFLTPIKYLDKELFVDTKASDDTEFPVLLMDWVEGETLDKYIRKHLDDQYELSLIAYQFSRLAMWLMPQPFAHGDLKPDNILVKDDGTLVLVDYDGMYVPAMKGQRARELGSPDFRHPSRTETDFDDHIDDFSLASILLSLKAISLHPNLLDEYGAPDRLLLSERDYRNINQSKLLKTFFPSENIELNIIYSLFLLAYSKVNITGYIMDALNVIGDNFYKKAQKICHEYYVYKLKKENELAIKYKTKAYNLFKNLAIRGNEDGLRCMGCLLWKEGDGNDDKEIQHWYQLVANNCNERILSKFIEGADKFYKGDGVEQDYDKAFKMYLFASQKGSEYAMMMLVICYENGYGTPVDESLVQEWYKKIEDVKILRQIGQKYFEGKDVELNYEKAFFWFQEAGIKGDEISIMMLGFCYENGLGTPVNDTNAHLWYDKIHDGNIAFSIGLKYFEGEIIVDYRKAVLWFSKAIDLGEASAYPYLAVCYRQGLGVDFKNLSLAQDLFNKASSSGFKGLIEFCFNQSNYELSCSLLRIWLIKIQKEHAEDIDDWLPFWDAVNYKEELEKKGFKVFPSGMKNDIIVQKTLSNSFHLQDSDDFNLLSVDEGGKDDDEKKYGVVKDRWGNFLIGRYKIDRKQLNFWGVICRKHGIFSHCYAQRFEQMVKTDYPLEISKEIYDSVFSIMTISMAEIVEILNDQPQKQRPQIVNSKFFIRCDKEIHLCNVSFISDTYTCYNGIHLSCKDYPSLSFNKSFYGIEEKEKEYGSIFLESKVYEIISQKIKDTQMTLELIINKAYNNKYSIANIPAD